MCLSKYSNLEHLREVAVNLCSSDDLINVNGLCERELAALINAFYQNQQCEVIIGGEKRKCEVDTKRKSKNDTKRKSEVDTKSDNKKPRFYKKLSNILSALELLPNEVYEMILKCISGQDKLNMRITCKGLYYKTTLLAPMFSEWRFKADKGTQPDFVLKTDKNFHVSALKNSSKVDPTSNLINNYTHRISSIRIDLEGVLLNKLNLNPAEFTHLTSLDLENVYFKSESLLMLSPQLVDLRLVNLNYCHKFDISSVDEESKCFTKLKTLKLKRIEIDVKKILTKCCDTLETLELNVGLAENFDQELSSLKYLFIYFEDHFKYPVRNLLTKCSGSLRTLKFIVGDDVDIDFLPLLDQTMKITTLFIAPGNINLDMFISKCPLIQNLTLMDYYKELKEVSLKDLINLELTGSGNKCITSALELFKSSLKTLNLIDSLDEIMECEFPEIKELDTVWIYFILNNCRDLKDEELDQLLQLFPETVTKVTTGSKGISKVLRRVYDLQ